MKLTLLIILATLKSGLAIPEPGIRISIQQKVNSAYGDGIEILEDNPGITNFVEFESFYNKSYVNEEERMKKKTIVEKKIKKIKDHNMRYKLGLETYNMRVNQNCDLTFEEFKIQYMGIRTENHQEYNPVRRTKRSIYVPTNIVKELKNLDYRNKGAVNPIRDQSGCGSCWAFSVISSIESQIFIKYKKLLQLSEQYLVDCVDPEIKICKGYWLDDTFNYISREGVASRKIYRKYDATQGKCNAIADKYKMPYKVTDTKQINNDADLLNALVNVGPVSVSMYVDDKFSLVGEKGVYDGKFWLTFDPKSIPKNVGLHAMLLIGYGPEYWIIRNSWGTNNFGDNGYFKFSRKIDNNCGISELGAFVPEIEVKCTFPFYYQGTLFYTCTNMNHFKPWCATATDNDNNYIDGHWNECDDHFRGGVRVASGVCDKCMFPFIYRGISFDICTDLDSAKPWCATVTDNDNNYIDGHWVECDDHFRGSCANQDCQFGGEKCVCAVPCNPPRGLQNKGFNCGCTGDCECYTKQG